MRRLRLAPALRRFKSCQPKHDILPNHNILPKSQTHSRQQSPYHNPELPRINLLGIQYLSQSLHSNVFPTVPINDYKTPKNNDLLEIAKSHLNHHNLLGKTTQINAPINIPNIPKIIGNSMDEHFYNLGKFSGDNYMAHCTELFSQKLPPRPSKWLFRPGWYRYQYNKEPEPVPYPLEHQLVFDVEVLYKKSHYPILATCVSPKAWYGWVSPLLTTVKNDASYDDYEHLIPMNTLVQDKLIVGFNVSYDRARILDEYNLQQSKAFFLDGMALHIAVSGLCGHQRPQWLKHQKNLKTIENDDMENDDIDCSTNEMPDKFDLVQDLLDDPWLAKGAPNSLANVAKFHCNIDLDKNRRDAFATEDPLEIIQDFNNLMDYCSDDVIATFEVTKKLFPMFQAKIPHPVSFAALRHLGTLILPTTKQWDTYIHEAETVYNQNRQQVTTILHDRVNELVAYIDTNDETLKPDTANDPWLRQLDWTVKQPRIKKNGEPLAKQAFLTGYPQWYRDLFKTTKHQENQKPVRLLNITVRTRITALLLRLKWEGYPLFWVESQGWCFRVPLNEQVSLELEKKGYTKVKLSLHDYEQLGDLETDVDGHELFKVPHPDGPTKRCTIIMSKGYSQYFDSGVLTSEYLYAQEILDLNSAASYWMGNRGRILDQFVYNKTPELGLILPKLVTMGTITRRATENTWLTASNAKRNRIGSELKSLITAPPGYKFVGADVDSEELWIAALIGDSAFQVHGSSALSWMTLEGNKSHNTDLHSKTADILGISRNEAKIFNYGRIYGAGVKFATTLLKQCNARLSDEEAATLAKRLYRETKGDSSTTKFLPRKIYHGGTESVMFNALESIAHLEDPRTPVLGAAITDALTAKNLNKNNYLTSRTNWAIQSSGVDYLHLLIISMEYLLKTFQLEARLMLTVHDEVRYLVKDADRYKVALCLQISNLWTRAMFAERLGFTELPQSVAFFSEVDIDHVLRKEVTLDCVTPSQPQPIPPGESLNIVELLEKEIHLSGSNGVSGHAAYKPQPLIVDVLTKDLTSQMKVAKAKLEMSSDKHHWKKNVAEYSKLQPNLVKPTKAAAKLPKQKLPKPIMEYDIVSDGDEELQRTFAVPQIPYNPTLKRPKASPFIPDKPRQPF